MVESVFLHAYDIYFILHVSWFSNFFFFGFIFQSFRLALTVVLSGLMFALMSLRQGKMHAILINWYFQ